MLESNSFQKFSKFKKSQLIKNLILGKGNLYKKEVSIDSKLLEIFFSDNEGLYSQEKKEFNFEQAKKVDEIYYIIDNMLPEIEKQIIYLLFFLERKQEIVGRLLKISQEMVCYYKKRALARIKLHYFFRSIDIEKMEKFFVKYLTKKQRIAMIEYFKEHDLRKIVERISKTENKDKPLNYIAIGSRIKLGLKRLRLLKDSKDGEIRENANLYFKIFTILKKHNSLYHTQSKKQISSEIKA